MIRGLSLRSLVLLCAWLTSVSCTVTMPAYAAGSGRPLALGVGYDWTATGLCLTLEGKGEGWTAEAVTGRATQRGQAVRFRSWAGAWRCQLPDAVLSPGRVVSCRIRDAKGRDAGLLQVRRPALMVVPPEGLPFPHEEGMVVWGGDGSQAEVTLDEPGAFVTAVSEAAAASFEASRVLPHDLVERGSSLMQEPVKDEFESSTEFLGRVREHNRAIEAYNAARAEWIGGLPGSLSRAATARTVAGVFRDLVPSPFVNELRYDADQRVMYAELGPEPVLAAYGMPAHLALDLSPAQARDMKARSDELEPLIVLALDDRAQLRLRRVAVRLGTTVWPCRAATESSGISLILPEPKATADVSGPGPGPLAPMALEVGRDEGLARLKAGHASGAGAGVQDPQGGTRAAGGEGAIRERVTAAASVPVDPRRHVLAVGITRHASLPDAPFAAQGADLMALAAGRLLGVPEANTITLKDDAATFAGIGDALARVVRQVRPGDTLVVYLAGHGVASGEGTDLAFAAHDADRGRPEPHSVPVNELLRRVAAVGGVRIVLVADVCFGGRVSQTMLTFAGRAPVEVMGLPELPGKSSATVMLAGSGEQFAHADTRLGHRLLTWFMVDRLLAGLRDMPELFEAVRDGVQRASTRQGEEQMPVLQGDAAAGL